MVEFYEGVLQLRARAAGYFADIFLWSNLTLSYFYSPKPTLPSSNEILSGFHHAMTPEKSVKTLVMLISNFFNEVANVIADMNGEIVNLS